MVKYKMHENGWTVILEDFDFKTATQDDINHIARLLARNTVVVAKGQHLNIEDEVRVAKMFKDPQCFDTMNTSTYEHNLTGSEIAGSEGYFLRVSGEKDEHGLVGIAGHVSEMVWHCNDPGGEIRKPIVWLSSQRGSKGSRTTWNNNILSYADLDDVVKEKLKNLHLEVMKESEVNADIVDEDYEISSYYPSVVTENIAGKRGLYFPFLQAIKFKELSEEDSKEIFSWLAPFTVQEKYCYHHDWDDGDIVIAEQNLGLHKRWRFEAIAHRVLHRGAFDFPDQNYKS
jgi:alpha-ketoglutarate-dependent taurine dioxygenase